MSTTMTTITPIAEPPRMAGIVLAGGLSSRMGRDKALLQWQGQTLLAHMHGLLKRAGAGIVRVSGSYPEFDGIADVVGRCGPLGGLFSVANTLPDGPAWVVPVDMPQLDVALLQQLRDAPPAACVIFAGQPLPMRLNIDEACRTLLQSMIQDPDGPRSLQALQRRLGVLELAVPDAAAASLANCNTPEQWEELAS